MRELITEVLSSVYLASPGSAIWRWSADGRALEWSEGATVLIREELEQLLARLTPLGLPSLTCLVLICGACRETWKGSSRSVLAAVLDAIKDPPAHEAGVRRLKVVLSQVLAGLDKVSKLPLELRRGVDAKAALCEALIESLPVRLEPGEAASVVDTLSWIRPAQSHELGSGLSALGALEPDLRALREALDRFDARSLEQRVRTGIEESLQRAPVELPSSERVRRLLAELRGDPDLAGLSRLASDLLAAVHVPRPLLDRDEQPLGGVADVSNRGPLDRLLLSELAHDELTFMVRIAMGEALYLRREAPPRRPPVERRLLLDCGIRLWGTPRLFATAVGLALAADSAAGTRVLTYRACQGEALPVDLLSREGLLEQLAQLEPDPEPGRALEALLGQVAQASAPIDLVLVTHRDALADPSLRRRLRTLPPGAQVYVASVDAEGAYELWRFGERGRKRVARAHLDLRRLLQPQSAAELPGRELSVKPLSRSLPRILSLDPFPLRMPCPLRTERACHHPRFGVLATSPDRRLMHWSHPGQGARELTACLPPGLTRWIEIDEQGVGRCLRDGARAPVLVLADLEQGKVARLDLVAPPSPQAAYRIGSVLALVYRRQVAFVSLTTGERLEPLRTSARLTHLHGRVFRAGDGALSALCWSGSGASLQLLPDRELHPRVLLAWEREGLDGFWVLLSDGAVRRLGEPPGGPAAEVRVLLPGARPSVSRDGHRLLVLDTRGRAGLSTGDAENRRLLFDLRTGQTRRALGEPLALEPELAPFARAPTLRKRVQAVGVDPLGRLALVTRRRRVLALALDPSGEELRLVSGEEGGPVLYSHLRGLTPVEAPPGRGFSLRRATWRDGSRAFLDGRGLLHLQSSREDAPEITLVLVERGPVAAWLSGEGGGLAGESYFVGDQPVIPVAEAYRQLRCFVERLR